MEVKSLPEPEVNKSREALGLAGVKMADLFSLIRSNTKEYSIRGSSELAVEIQRLTSELEGIIQSVFIVAKPYVLIQDQKEFMDWEKRLESLDQNYSLGELRRFVDFAELMLKNTNLTELGVKSRFKEIEEVINVEAL